MTTAISATQAARSFSDLLARVRYRGEEVVVEKGGKPICRVTPVRIAPRSTAQDLARALATLPRPDREYFDHVERAVRRQGKVPKSPWAR
jgi:prevent-host-death family protein